MADPREPTVLLAHSSRSWMQNLHFHLVDHGGALVGGYALSADDALAAGSDVFVVDDVCSFLTSRLVVDLHDAGTRVIGVYDATDGEAGHERLAQLAVDECLPADAGLEQFVTTVRRLALQPVPPAGVPRRGHISSRLPTGRVVAVAGAGGGTGATEIAIAVSARVSSRGRSVVLVDTDEVTPSVAQRLGLPLHPNIRTAIEAVVHGVGSPLSSVTPHAAGFGVVSGLPNSEMWHDLRPGEVVSSIREFARLFSVVVANVAGRVESAPAGAAPGRFGVSRAVVAAADVVVLVGTPSPVGVARMAEWLAHARTPAEGKEVHLVLNTFPAGGFRSKQITDELLRFVEPASLTIVPFDRKVRSAEWRAVAVGRGPLRRAVRRVAARIDGGRTA